MGIVKRFLYAVFTDPAMAVWVKFGANEHGKCFTMGIRKSAYKTGALPKLMELIYPYSGIMQLGPDNALVRTY